MYKKVIAAVLAASIGLGSGSASAMLPNGGFGFPGGNGGSGGPGTPFFSREKGNINLNLPIQNIDLEAPDSIDAEKFMLEVFDRELTRNNLNNIAQPLTQEIINKVRNEILAVVRPLGSVRYGVMSELVSVPNDDLLFETYISTCGGKLSPAELKLGALIYLMRGVFKAIKYYRYAENSVCDLRQRGIEFQWLERQCDRFVSLVRTFNCLIDDFSKAYILMMEVLAYQKEVIDYGLSGSVSALLRTGGVIFPRSSGGSGRRNMQFLIKLKWDTNINLASRIRDIILEEKTHAIDGNVGVIDAAEFMEIALKECLENSNNENIRNGCPGLPLTQELINEVRNEMLTMVRPFGNLRLRYLEELMRAIEQYEFCLHEFCVFCDWASTNELRVAMIIIALRILFDLDIAMFCEIEEILKPENDNDEKSLIEGVKQDIHLFIQKLKEQAYAFEKVN